MSFEVKYQIRKLHRTSKSKGKKLVKSVHKQEIGLLWSSESFEGEYNILYGIPIEFPSQRKFIKIGPETTRLCFN